ncbi:MAG: autoinducer 2 ABC transporter substrate-binding protein [Oscillospiraceae bacterium]|nr:autoinducer 2 ABC transporter substrate-binding protein [Oscillospiraceae bacterium]
MKKLLSLALAFAMVLTLVACGGSKTSTSTAPAASGSTAPAPAEKEWKIATVVKDSSDPWFIRMEEGVQDYAAATGNNAFQKGPATYDSAQQVQIIEELIAQDIDAICVVPIDPAACENVLKKAMDQGIVVITHEATTQQNCDYNIEAFDNVGYGAYMMDELAKAMGEEGEYVCMVGFLTTASHMEWSDAAIARQKEKYPNMKLIDIERVETEDSMEVAYEKAKELLKTYPNLKGFLGTSSYDAPGAGKAIAELSLVGKAFAAGTSVTSCCADQLTDGSMTAALCWDPATAGYAMNVLAEKVLNGEEADIANGYDLGVEGYESLNVNGKYLNGAGWIVITKDNMGEYNF